MVAPAAYTSPYFQKRQNLNGLAGAAVGTNLAFPGGDRFANFGQNQSNQIIDYANDYGNMASQRRNDLMKSLTDLGQQQFSLANPAILEDLNRRGLATSPTAVSGDQANALKEIALQNQNQLLNVQNQDYANEDALRQGALEANIGAQQTGLENTLSEEQAARESELANSLAKRQQRYGITNSLIGAGGSLLGGALSGGLGGLFGGGKGGGGGGDTPGPSLASVFPSLAGAGGLLPGATLGSLGQMGLGYGAQAGINSAIGQALGKGLYKSDAARTASRKGAQIGSLVMPGIGGIAGGAFGGAATKVKNVFCFAPMTRIEYTDGTTGPICWTKLGDEIKGGKVESIRQSITPEGTLYNYKGIQVTGMHAVKEDGKWIRIEDSPHSQLLDHAETVYSLCTTDHRIFIDGIEFADEIEHDDYENMTIDESLARLNHESIIEVSTNGA